MKTNPRKAFVDIARDELWVRETSRNHGPGIEKYWTATTYKTGYQNREPYCAAFVCWVCRTAERLGHGVGPVPNSAAVREIVRWAQGLTRGAVVFLPGSKIYKPQAGDLVWFRFGGNAPNHIGFVTGTDGANAVRTIEANTGIAGGRDGDGVWRKGRSLSVCKGFIRLAWKAVEVRK
jgi:hypothetical protein